jgi:hypothetical protein
MHRAIRGLSRLTGWKWRTRAESPLARRANRVFADAKAHDSLYSYVEFFGCFRGVVTRQPTDPFSARVRATRQGAIHRSRTSDNHRWPQPILDARRARRRVFVAEVGRKSGSRPASSEEYSSSWQKRSALIRPPLFRVRRVCEYPSRGGLHSLFRDRTASDTDALQLEDVPTTESGHGAWRSPQLLSD